MLQDATTGLYYTPARWYSATQGRFLTRDPSGESGGLNLYAYCENDPVNLSDLTGLGGDPVALKQEYATSPASCLQCHTATSVSAVPFLHASLPSLTEMLQAAPAATPTLGVGSTPSGGLPGLQGNVFSVWEFVNAIQRPDLNVSAEALVMAGRSLAPNVVVVPYGDNHADLDTYVQLGRSLAAKEHAQQGISAFGYYDVFGWHSTFCMSCHDGRNAASLFELAAARNGANNNWGVFVGRDLAPLAVSLGLTAAPALATRSGASVIAVIGADEAAPIEAIEAGSVASRQGRVAARSIDDVIDRQLRADALRIWRQFPPPFARNGTTVATGIFNGQRAYAVSNNTTAALVRQAADDLGYTRIFGKAFTDVGETEAEQILLNWAEAEGLLDPGAGAAIAPQGCHAGFRDKIAGDELWTLPV